MQKQDFVVDPSIDIAWCPGCGNFLILKILKKALEELNIDPKNLVTVSGIGQAAKIPQYFKTNYFNGLHGRALPPAVAIKASNPELTVITASGDGDTYGEGGNHFMHNIRRNPDITHIVHNNMVYGLTKGQASPTSQTGFKTPIQTEGVILQPFNPIAVAIALDASFVARAFCGDEEKTREIFKKAIMHKGYALIDVFQPCVTFNKVNNFKWFKDNSYYLEEGYDPHNKSEAFNRATNSDKFPLGIIYLSPEKTTFENNIVAYRDDKTPIIKRPLERKQQVQQLINSHT